MGHKLTHLNKDGRAKMVDVGSKQDTERLAIAEGSIYMKLDTLKKIKEGSIKKGDVLAVAQVAGVMAAKKTSDIIPMCHNIFVSGVDMSFEIDEENSAVHIKACAKTVGKTGIEMESLNAVSVAALTIYDMCKAIDRGMRIENIHLTRKEGGKSGMYQKGKVIAVNISDKTGVRKQSIESAEIKEGGIVGDAHFGKSEIKQISLLADESVDKMRGMGMEFDSGIFAENITTKGIELKDLPVGVKLRIGDTLHEVSQIGKECHGGCEIRTKTGFCVMPTDGIFTKVLKSGTIKPGDDIEIIE